MDIQTLLKSAADPTSTLQALLSRRADETWRPRVRVVMPHRGGYLLEQLHNPKYPENLGKTRFPGGGVDPGETMQEAAVRELWEELSHKITPDKLRYLGQDPRPERSYEHYFELPGHGLAPGQFKAHVGSDPTVHLIRGQPKGEKYFGAPIQDLLKTARGDHEIRVRRAARESSNGDTIGRLHMHGLRISIETPKGSQRTGTGSDGKPWSRTVKAHYGCILGSESRGDGMHVDIWLGECPESELVFVVKQLKEDGTFDEEKVVLGTNSLKEAKKLYLSNYPDGFEKRIGGIVPMSLPNFKRWLSNSCSWHPHWKSNKTAEDQQIEDDAVVNAADYVKWAYGGGDETMEFDRFDPLYHGVSVKSLPDLLQRMHLFEAAARTGGHRVSFSPHRFHEDENGVASDFTAVQLGQRLLAEDKALPPRARRDKNLYDLPSFPHFYMMQYGSTPAWWGPGGKHPLEAALDSGSADKVEVPGDLADKASHYVMMRAAGVADSTKESAFRDYLGTVGNCYHWSNEQLAVALRDAEEKTSAWTYAPTSALSSIRQHGLLSGKSLLDNPEAMAAAVQGRGTTSEALTADIQRSLSGFKPDSALGPNIMFSQPPASVQLHEKHPLRTMALSPIEIDLHRLLKDVPGTRVHGQELMPYKEYEKRWTKEQLDKDQDDPSLRHRDLAPAELRKLLHTPAEKLWSTYSDPEGVGMYAPNVPHAAVITPTGAIPASYLKLPEETKTAQPVTLYRGQGTGEDPNQSNYAALAARALRGESLSRSDKSLLHLLGRRREQFYTPDQSQAARYGPVHSLTVPPERLGDLRVTYNNLGKRNEFLTAAIDRHVADQIRATEKSADISPDIKLQEHQQRIADEAAEEPIRKLLVHGLGTGKSLSALAASEASGDKVPYTIVAPASLRPTWKKERAKFTDEKTPASILSYEQAARGLGPTEKLIVDEAQNLRNPGTARSAAVADAAQRAKQLILLSGTPLVNKPSDIVPALNMLTGKSMTPHEFESRFVGTKEVGPGILGYLLGRPSGVEPDVQNRDELKKLLQGHVDWYKPEQTAVPVNHQDISVDMSPLQSRLYKAMTGELPWLLRYKLQHDIGLAPSELRRAMSFLTGPRQVGLSPMPFLRNKDPLYAFEHSSKLQKAFELAQETLKDPRRRMIAYSNFPRAGLEPYHAALTRAGIPAAIFHGGLGDAERKRLVDDFNAGKLRAALVGPAGAEGISLKGSQLLQILDPHFNAARTRQAEGRGLRFDSHIGLPEDLRNMQIQRFVSKAPLGLMDRMLEGVGVDQSSKRRAADDYLRSMSARKDRELGVFMDLLKEVGEKHEKKAAKLSRYRCPRCGGTNAFNGDPVRGSLFRGGAECQDCHHTYSLVGLPQGHPDRTPCGEGPDIGSDNYQPGPHTLLKRERAHETASDLYNRDDSDKTAAQFDIKGLPKIRGRRGKRKTVPPQDEGTGTYKPSPHELIERERSRETTSGLYSQEESDKYAAQSDLQQLLKAKELSDHGDYGGKHSIVIPLIGKNPSHWVIDQDDPNSPVVGLTHLPSKFRIHMPRASVESFGLQPLVPAAQPRVDMP